ncbi:putative metal-binding motif-containing protein [Corallococcus sp. EGB]|uniref:putative metal-binding motif-containing protein n=1 Tax=Corallococcus sp. EGB TaxID=1521117 RepID=UPI002105C143|nr:putative metal-binding motif-containing protein [Corallococcus sp. EGB]
MLLAACGEKAPDEGAIRVSVKYGSFQPACVRVEVKDASGHGDRTDILSSQFKNADKKEVRVAVRRKADWDAALSVTASSYAAATAAGCDGAFVEKYESDGPLAIVAKKFTSFDVTLKATDADGDGHLADAMWDEPADCDDSNPAVHPGAVESCGSTKDLNCNQRVGCQEEGCGGNPCDDGNACTTGDHCEGVGLEARCVPAQTTTCTQPTGACDARQECNPTSGRCEAVGSMVGKSCDDRDECTAGDICGADGKCTGIAVSCTNSTDQCLASVGTCIPATGKCVFAPLPPTTSCQDARTCTTDDHCDGTGNCVATPGTCTPPPCYRVKQQCTASTECDYELDLNGVCTTASGVPGVCQADATCTPFPYRPYNFDPKDIAAADIGELKTTGNVTFDTASSTWAPSGAMASTPKVLSISQSGGNPPVLLIPVRTLELKGSLTLKGPSPVILAVYGDANVDQSILATGSIANPNAACGASQGRDGAFGGKTGGGGGGAGNGTTGVDGGKGNSTGASPGVAGIVRPAGAEPLLGGCPGGNGGGSGSATGGKGGAGGGAFQLSVARNLTVAKTISASGTGGDGGKGAGNKGAGGGGGGSGGRVVLEAFQLTLTPAARVTANGGGGGEGGSSANNDGRNASDGSTESASPAAGGTGGATTGGDGGDGGAGTTGPGKGIEGTKDAFSTEGGGGGGGGAAGYIHLRSVQSCSLAVGHVISPPATGGCATP